MQMMDKEGKNQFLLLREKSKMFFTKKGNGKSEHSLSRRNFLKLGMLATLANLSPYPSFAAIRKYTPSERSVSLYNIHTEESLRTVYWLQGEYLPEALDDINYIMRDFRANKIKPIDIRLLDLLNAIRIKLGTMQYFHIVSGYRSPATNEFLRKKSNGVSKNSLHMYGKAVDIRVPKHEIFLVRRTAMKLRFGGVGYYPDSNFVHMDVGKVRYWQSDYSL